MPEIAQIESSKPLSKLRNVGHYYTREQRDETGLKKISIR